MLNDEFSFVNEEILEFWPFVEKYHEEGMLLMYGVFILDFEPTLIMRIALYAFPPVYSSIHH